MTNWTGREPRDHQAQREELEAALTVKMFEALLAKHGRPSINLPIFGDATVTWGNHSYTVAQGDPCWSLVCQMKS